MQSHLYPCQQAHPSIIMSYTRAHSSSPLSGLLCSLGREQALKHPTNAKAGLCPPAVLRKSQPQVLSAVQVSTVHTLWQKIGSTLGISLVPSFRCGAGGRFTTAAGRVVIQEHKLTPPAVAAQMFSPSLLPCAPGLCSSSFLKQRTFSFFWKKVRSHPSGTGWLGKKEQNVLMHLAPK